MPSSAILRKLRNSIMCSDSLDALAEEHPVVSEALITISGNLRQTATLLEVLVATKLGPLTGGGPAMA